MRKLFTIALSCAFLLMAFAVQAQRVVDIPPTTDFENPSDIFPVIMGDTTTDGSRVDNNTVYKLANGGFYITSGRLVNKPEWDLVIEAKDVTDTENKAVLTVVPNASGTYPEIARPEGNFTLRNLWVIAGEKGPGEDPEWGQIFAAGENIRIIYEDLLMEKERGGFIQFRANGVKAYVTNCEFRNAGNRRLIQGNGRGFDGRNFNIDSLVVKNSIFYNIHDRIFRSQGATQQHNYIEFDHNTIFNHFGRHGCFQFGRAKKLVITNNLISNPIMQGTTPVFADEQTQKDNETHKVFTIDTLYGGEMYTFSNNNIFWTQDVLDVWEGIDTVANSLEVYSEQVAELVGDEAAQAASYFTEVVELNSVPGTILQLVKDTYADPTSTDMFDIIVEDISRAGTDFDFGNLFDFSTFDAGFDPEMYPLSASGDMNGKAVGAVPVSGGVGIAKLKMENSKLKVYPNPSQGSITLEYSLERTENVRVSIYDMSGKEQMILLDKIMSQGVMQLNADLASKLDAGMYLIKFQSGSTGAVSKLILK